jgi:hypothetical protein
MWGTELPFKKKKTTLWFLYPNFLKIVPETNGYADFIHKPLFEHFEIVRKTE